VRLSCSQVAKLCSVLVGPDVDVSIYSCDKGHTLADLRRSCRVHLSARRAGTSVIIANMYMGAECKNGLGSRFDMGHFALIAAYTRGSRAIPVPASNTHIESDACLGLPMPQRKRRGVRGCGAVTVGAGGDGGEEGEKEGTGGHQAEMCLVMDVWAQASDAYWVPLEKV
jgi:hypothetical protein